MKKNIIVIVALIIGAFAFSGCNGTFDIYEDDPYYGTPLTTLYLVDEYGNSYSGIPYKCDSMYNWSSTAYNGEFTFYPPDDCEFDFRGLNGNNGDLFSDIVRIVDYSNDSKSNIQYDCRSFGGGTTYYDGSFDYNIDDECLFYL